MMKKLSHFDKNLTYCKNWFKINEIRLDINKIGNDFTKCLKLDKSTQKYEKNLLNFEQNEKT